MERMFYRAKLATIVWDPAAEKPLAEFVGGKFITDDDAVAEKLAALGYPEVPLDAEAPPILPPDPVQTGESEDVRPLPAGMTEEGMLVRQKREDMLAKTSAETAAKVKAAAEDKETKAKGSGQKGKPKRKIKRRSKE